MSRSACLLCGAEDQETRMLLVRWRDPLPGFPYGAVPRCVDRVACRARIEARGDRWEVVDATDTTRPADPMQPLRPTPADALEEVFG